MSRCSSSAKITITSRTTITKKMAPNAAKRRISEMSEFARQQLPGLPPVVEPDLEALELFVEVVAQLGLDARRHPRQRETAAVRQRELDDRQHDCEHEQGHQPALVPVVDGTVDRGLGDEGYGELRADRDHCRSRDEGQSLLVRAEIRENSPQCSLTHRTLLTRE